jgi:hypothetical protein
LRLADTSFDNARTLVQGQAGPTGIQKKLLRAEGLQEYIPAELTGVLFLFSLPNLLAAI